MQKINRHGIQSFQIRYQRRSDKKGELVKAIQRIFLQSNTFLIFHIQQDATYNKEAESQAREWIEAITEETIGGSDFLDGLRDGSHLCRLETIIPTVRRRYRF